MAFTEAGGWSCYGVDANCRMTCDVADEMRRAGKGYGQCERGVKVGIRNLGRDLIRAECRDGRG